MLRIIAGVLAAFVGFSFGHSLPKWMEHHHRQRTCAPGNHPQCPPRPSSSSSPSSSPPQHHYSSSMKLMLRRKSLRTFKLSSYKSAKAGTDDDGESLDAIKAHPPAVKSGKRYGFRSKKSAKKDIGAASAAIVSMKSQNCLDRDTCEDNVHVKFGGAGFCNVTSDISMPGSPIKAKGQMKHWKMKLISLRSKAMETEKVWFEKLSSELSGGKASGMALSKGSLKKPGKGKENQSSLLASYKRREPSWSRSTSRVGLLAEGPNSGIER